MTVTLVEAGMTAVAVVMTIADDDGVDDVPANDPLIVTLGVAKVLKKPDGYINDMKLPIASEDPEEVVKLNDTDTFVLLAIRLVARISNMMNVTRLLYLSTHRNDANPREMSLTPSHRVSQLSNEMTSASVSLRLYTSTV